MTAPFQGTISAAGRAGAAVLSLTAADAQVKVELSPGTPSYVGAQLVFEALPLGSTVWFPVSGVEQDGLVIQTGTAAAPFAITPDGNTLALAFDVSGCSALRVWASVLTSGVIQVNGSFGSFFSGAPTGGALSYAVQLATLWQLQHLTFLLAQMDEKVNASWVTNPILPAGLPPATWDVTG